MQHATGICDTPPPSPWRGIREHLTIGVVSLLLVLGLPLIALNVFLFAGFDGAAAWWARHSPAWIVDDDELDRINRDWHWRRDLLASGTPLRDGPFAVLCADRESAEHWLPRLASAGHQLHVWLGSRPWLPVCEIRPLDHQGQYRLFVLEVNGLNTANSPGGATEAEKTLYHELSHAYMFWALLPGLPVDCPRWFNEGMAEALSGGLIGDEAGYWRFVVVPQRWVRPFTELSAAFSDPGGRAEIQARHAFSTFLSRFGWQGVRRVMRGLRAARPFASALPWACGVSLASFERDCLLDFQNTRVVENLPQAAARARLEGLARVLPASELDALVRDVAPGVLSPELILDLRQTSCLAAARRSLQQGRGIEAFGWVRQAPFQDLPEVADLRTQSRSCSEPTGVDTLLGLPRPTRRPWVAPLLSLLLLWLASEGYLRLRRALVPALRRVWTARHPAACWWRWCIAFVMTLGGGWFLRFLIVALPPYAGYGGLDDHQRIILGEVACIVWWSILLLWDRQAARAPRSSCRLSGSAMVRNALGWGLGMSILITIVSAHTPLASVFLPDAVLHGINALAFLAYFRRKVHAWSPAVCTIPPVLLYVLYRGGFSCSASGYLLLALAGWLWVKLVRENLPLGLFLILDLSFLLPLALSQPGVFPAQDPVLLVQTIAARELIEAGAFMLVILAHLGLARKIRGLAPSSNTHSLRLPGE